MHRLLNTRAAAPPGLALVAALLATTPLSAQQASSDADTTARTTRARSTLAVPVEGQTIRILTPTLPARDRRMTGAFLGVDSSAEGQTLGLRTAEGTRFVPCSLIHAVEVPRARHTPLWQKTALILVGAWGGLYVGHAAADAPGGVSTEDPPLPHPDRDRAAHRRENRIMIAGATLGAGLAYFIIRDTDRWRPATLGACGTG